MDIGPKSYRKYKNGYRLVIRFFVSDKIPGSHSRSRKFFVFDMEAVGRIAGMTSKDGYQTKEEAVEIARKYRDKYGAYTRFKY